MRVIIDEEACVGAGQCVLTAADVFDQRDDGVAVLLQEEPSAAAAEAVVEAAALCPTQAIQVLE